MREARDMLYLDENECHVMTMAVLKCYEASVDEYRQAVFEALESLVPFACGVSFIMLNEADDKRHVKPISYKWSPDAPSFEEMSAKAIRLGKSYPYRSLEWRKESLVFRDTDVLSEEFLQSSDFYQQVRKPIGMHYSCKLWLVKNNLLLGKFGLLRPKEMGNFTDLELMKLRCIEPHVAQRLYQFHPQNDENQRIRMVLKQRFGLTEREIQITGLLCRGWSNRQISERVNSAESTVKKHVYVICKKMNVPNRASVMCRCVLEGVMPQSI